MSDKTFEQLEQELQDSQKSLATASDKLVESDLIIEDLKAENESLKAEVQRLLATPDEKEAETGVGSTFEYGDNTYKVLCTAIRIPGLGRRTAMEILVDTDAQKKLVESGSGAIRKME